MTLFRRELYGAGVPAWGRQSEGDIVRCDHARAAACPASSSWHRRPPARLADQAGAGAVPDYSARYPERWCYQQALAKLAEIAPHRWRSRPRYSAYSQPYTASARLQKESTILLAIMPN